MRIPWLQDLPEVEEAQPQSRLSSPARYRRCTGSRARPFPTQRADPPGGKAASLVAAHIASSGRRQRISPGCRYPVCEFLCSQRPSPSLVASGRMGIDEVGSEVTLILLCVSTENDVEIESSMHEAGSRLTSIFIYGRVRVCQSQKHSSPSLPNSPDLGPPPGARPQGTVQPPEPRWQARVGLWETEPLPHAVGHLVLDVADADERLLV